MLNTKKFLYILPDGAYISEVLPTKKAHTFSIHAFRQINGTFIDDNELIAENVKKLIHKIEPETYHLVLPDFLFTNTIVDVQETKESAVKSYIQEKLLPTLEMTKETHQIQTFILTQHGNKTKVQISALEKSLLEPIENSAAAQNVIISHVSALSWTVKSLISLEPSLSTIQIGEMLYLALHYIGVDQTISFNIADTANIIETVKTLKGAEPNLQTMYLFTNPVIEQQIKEQLSGTLPIQQLTSTTDDTEGIPSYIKQIITTAAKTFDIPDMQTPVFELGKTAKKDKAQAGATPTSEEAPETTSLPADLGKTAEPELPLPSMPKPTLAPVAAPVEVSAALPKIVSDLKPVPIALDEVEETVTIQQTVTTIKEVEPEPEVKEEQMAEKTPAQDEEQAPENSLKESVPENTTPLELPTTSQSRFPTAPKPELVPPPPVVVPSIYKPPMNQEIIQNTPDQVTPVAVPPKKIIKNTNDAAALVKIVLITLTALFSTVALGIGIGFGLLKLSERNSVATENTPIVQPSASPIAFATPTPVPSPTPAAITMTAADKAKLKILVVNATKVAGKAGTIKSALTTAGYKSVETGNAKGTYSTSGSYFLASPAYATALDTLAKDSKLTLTAGTTKEDEDPKQQYDVVIVFAE